MKVREMLLCLGLVVATGAPLQKAEGVIASVKSTGMAATAIAYPLDAVAAAFNPAGMAEVGDRFDLGITWAHDEGRAEISGNSIAGVNGSFDGAKTKDVYSPDFGINKELPCDMTIGLVVYNRNFNKSTYNNVFPLLGTSHAGLEYVHETVSPTWTMKFCDRHTIGVSVNYMVQRLKVNGLETFTGRNVLGNNFSAYPNNVTNKGYDYSTGWGFTLGVRSEITDCIAIGATYQPETSMDRFSKYKGFLADKGKFNIPQKIGAGIAWRLLPCVAVAFDVEHIRWTHIRALHNDLLPGLSQSQLGLKEGAGFGWKNQLYYRVGAEWEINNCWTVRAGFRHVNAPVRRSQTAVNLLSLETVEDFVTCGVTYVWDCCTEISAFYAHGFEKKIRGHDSIPPGSLALGGMGGGEVDLKAQKDAVGISIGRLF